MEYANHLFSYKKLKETLDNSNKNYKMKSIQSGKLFCKHQYKLIRLIEHNNSKVLEFECVKCKKIISFEW